MARPRRERTENGAPAGAGRYVPRLKTQYVGELRPRLKEELELSSTMQVPRLDKITLNMGVGEAKTDAKALDSAIEELTTIAGQRAQLRRCLLYT
jgi:large subunit ribosomal protein L5